jgi:16S rRNA (cytosine967-C5)-methyltransferase
MSPARSVAFRVLLEVERGGFACDLLLARSRGLDSRDAGLASEIVLGSLRVRAQLDFLIERLTSRAVERLDAEVLTALRMGIYQLRRLDRIPAHAAVDESVELVKRSRKRSAAGLVNAVLRKAGPGEVEWPDRPTALSVPGWILERWDRCYGRETAEKIARAFLEPPETFVRLPAGREVSGLDLEATDIAGCFRLRSGEERGLRIQDIGSQSIVPLLDLRSGQTFLDVSAAPGNKTAQALETGVRAVACDVSWRRLAPLKQLGCDVVVLDATEPLPFRRRFDRILLDAPCSGTGTMGRNPEIKWRLKPDDLARHQARQIRMLRRALEHLAPGGRLVYSTCSLEAEENEQVVEEVLGGLPATVARRIPGVDPGDGFFAAVMLTPLSGEIAGH